MHLDTDTLLFSSLSSRCSYLLVFLLIGLRQRRETYMFHWAGSIAMSMAGAWATARFTGYPILAADTGFFVYAIFGSSIALCGSGLRAFRGAPPWWPGLLFQAWLPGAACAAAHLLHLPPTQMLLGVFAAMAFNLVRTIGEAMAPAATGRLWSRYVVAAPLLAYLLMFVASMAAMILGHGPVQGQTEVVLPLIVDQGCSVLVYTGLLALSGEQAHARLKQLATQDQLTGLTNRQGLASVLEHWAAVRPDQAGGAAVLLLDIDHFKTINDGHGHAAGDAVLAEFARRARRVFGRTQDVVVRWGGEEFLVVMQGVDRATALRRAEELRGAVEAARFAVDGGALAVTVSAGLAQARPGLTDLDAAVARADAALYSAKRQGRNRVALHETIAAAPAEAPAFTLARAAALRPPEGPGRRRARSARPER